MTAIPRLSGKTMGQNDRWEEKDARKSDKKAAQPLDLYPLGNWSSGIERVPNILKIAGSNPGVNKVMMTPSA